jgi:primosomal protein N' (replication factor Y)
MTDRQHELFDTSPPEWEMDDEADQPAATVVFAEKPYGPFDYRIPDRLRADVEPGRRLRLPMGRGNRIVVGYCVAIQDKSTHAGRLKEVSAVVDPIPLLSPTMLRLTQWIAQTYLCPWGQVLEAVVPAGVRSGAGTREVTFYDVPTHVASRLTQLKLPAKQAQALRHLAASSRPMTAQQLAQAVGITTAPIITLRRKGLVRAETRRIHQNEHAEVPIANQPPWTLNDSQQTALDAVLRQLDAKQSGTIVIHGVTGSGKTEVYIQAIEEVVRRGRQAIVLVPEISLTPQTRFRFRSRLDSVAVLHSHLSASERHWHWQRIARGEVQVVVGARSAVFAPVPHLGLIILDEEHDGSFKQDSTPRYHARDVALKRAEMERIPLILGSATPSLETFYRAVSHEFVLVEMPHRVENRCLPNVATIDLRIEHRDRNHRGAISRPLHQAIGQALKEGGQVILLLNRRGFSTHIQCPACGQVVRCPDCDIALTHHRQGEKAVCHFCAYQTDPPVSCPQCRFEGIRYSGFGTQRLESEIRARFPAAECLRMDSDTMQRPGSYEKALDQFRSGQSQILLGTQMIAKGLDFPNVTLVGVVNADTALHLPDFRAAERTFQLVTQVAGRTGRGDKGGRVLVQTLSPEHASIQAAIGHDYRMFADGELPIRREYGYPPFARMIRIVVRGPMAATTEQFVQHIAGCLKQQLQQSQVNARILGPAAAPMARLRGKFRFHLQLQSRDGEALRQVVQTVGSQLHPPDEVQWIVDVDPLDML